MAVTAASPRRGVGPHCVRLGEGLEPHVASVRRLIVAAVLDAQTIA